MIQLYKFQEASVGWLSQKKRAILGSDVGTGKTAVAIRSADEVARAEGRKRIVVVCPASVRYGWEKEILKWSLYPGGIQVLKKSKEAILPTSRWVIVSYDMLVRMKDLDPPDLVILDEAHALKNPHRKRANFILGKEGFAKRANRTWFVTGSPFPNNIIDSWTMFAFCTWGRIGKYWDFAYHYCTVRDTFFGKRIMGGQNLEELAEKVKDIMRRDTVEEHISELPDSQEQVIPLEISPEAQCLIEDTNALKDAMKKLISGEGEKTEFKDLKSYSAILRDLSISKAESAAEFIYTLTEDGESVVVFSAHPGTLRKVGALLNASGHEHVYEIVGDTLALDRVKAINNFKAHGGVILLSIKAAGVGIDGLQDRARIAVFIDQEWTPMADEQAKARIRRLGQKNFCLFYYLQYPGSIDETIFEAVQAKARTIQKFWDVSESVTKGEVKKPAKVKKVDLSRGIIWD